MYHTLHGEREMGGGERPCVRACVCGQVHRD